MDTKQNKTTASAPETRKGDTVTKWRTLPAEKPKAIRLTENSSDTRVLDNIRRYRRKAAHADKLAEALREILDAPRNERNAIALLGRVEQALAAYESEVRS